jgi:hypothetical protein
MASRDVKGGLTVATYAPVQSGIEMIKIRQQKFLSPQKQCRFINSGVDCLHLMPDTHYSYGCLMRKEGKRQKNLIEKNRVGKVIAEILLAKRTTPFCLR